MYNTKPNIEGYASKFLAEHNDSKYPLTNETLKNTFKDCVLPLKEVFYPEVIQRIKEIRGGK